MKKRVGPLSNIAADKFSFLYLNIYTLCSLTDKPTDKIFVEYQASTLNSSWENHVFPHYVSYWLTERRIDGRKLPLIEYFATKKYTLKLNCRANRMICSNFRRKNTLICKNISTMTIKQIYFSKTT